MLKMAEMIPFFAWSNNIETNRPKLPPKMIYLSAMGAYCNEYGTWILKFGVLNYISTFLVAKLHSPLEQ